MSESNSQPEAVCEHDNQMEFCEICVCATCNQERGWIQCSSACKRSVCENCLLEDDGRCPWCRLVQAVQPGVGHKLATAMVPVPVPDPDPDFSDALEEHQPSGSCNFSHINSVRINSVVVGGFFPGHELLKSDFF